MSDTVFVKGDKVRNYTVLDNSCLRDPSISWGAKGFHSYLESLPGNWKIIKTDLYNRSSDKRYATDSLINELVAAGYIRIEEQGRESNGRFSSRCFIVYEIPIGTESENDDRCRFPAAGNSLPDNPLADNQQLLNTNKLNTNIQNTELTNSNQSVSESIFINIIKGLFGGEYLFDGQFETDVLRRLENAEIDQSYLDDYLNYVFERTKLANPIKSFEGLFRKLALSSSISRDFKLSLINKSEPKESELKPYENKIVCPICGTVFEQYDYYCPACSLSVDAIKSNDQQEITIKTKLHQMSDEERSKFDNDYQAFVKQKGRGFLTTEEQIQLYRDYGILD